MRAERILDHMYRRPNEDFARFRVSLRNVRQEHVILNYLEQLSTSVPESGSVGESTVTSIVDPSDQECQPRMGQVTAENDEMEVEYQSGAVTQPQDDQREYHLLIISIWGSECPSVRPSVRPQKVFPIPMKFGM